MSALLFAGLFTAAPIAAPELLPRTEAALTGSGSCVQDVGSTTGVTVTQSGNDCIVVFTSRTATTWRAPSGVANVRYLVVGGGGSGDRGNCGVYWGRGGGGGQVRTATLSVTSGTNYSVVVGKGGDARAEGCPNVGGNDGVASQFANITASPGLGGQGNTANGGASGSGFLGGVGSASTLGAGGGGGAGGAGSNKNGGIGVNSDITGTTVMYGSGGAGRDNNGTGTANLGGATGNGAASANTGAGGADYASGWYAGADGVVVLRYSFITFPTPAYNPTTLSIGSGIGGRSDTFTASGGTGALRFSLSPVRSGFSIDTSTANGAALVVSSLVSTGTYLETITVTDTSGFTVNHVVTVTVAAPVKWAIDNPTSITTTYGTAASSRLNINGGTTGRVVTLTRPTTVPLSGITIDTSTAITSNFVTLNVSSRVLPGTHTLTISVIDSSRIRSNQIFTVVVNKLPSLSFPSGTAETTTVIRSGLHLQYEIGQSYSGSGTTVFDLSGNNRHGSIVANPTYSASLGGGSLSVNGTNYLTTRPGVIENSDTLSRFYWIYPRSATQTILTVCDSVCAYVESELELFESRLYARVWNLNSVSTQETLTLNTWHYIGYIYDPTAGTTSIYVNGRLSASAPNSGTRGAPGEQYEHSGRATTTRMQTTEPGNYSLGSVHFYKRVLTEAEIFSNYAATAPRFLGTAFPGLSTSGNATITTTQGVASSHSLFSATEGTGGKTITLSSATVGVSLDTSTANSAILNIANTVTATNSTTQRTISTSVVATDSVTATTTYPLTLRINPPVLISAAIPLTLTTTFGRVAYDTFTATYGTGNKTFTGVSSAFQSAFVLTNPSTNVALLTVAATLPAGTYYETITATDSVGATATYVLTVVVNPAMIVAGASGNSVGTTVGRSASLRINVTGGTSTRTLATTNVTAGISIDSSTIASNFVTLNIGTTLNAGTYSFVITATDLVGANARETFTVTVNALPTISTSSTTITTTQGVSTTLGGSTSSGGTGNKTFVITGGNAGVSIDTATANSYSLTIANTVNATDTVTARTFTETVTATDSAGAVVRQAYTIRINPPIIETATSTSIATTSGIETSTVIYTTQGTGNKTFALSGATSGFSLTSGVNQATLRVLSTANPGTYNLTVTATDSVSATTALPITVVVSPPPTLLGISRIESTKGVAYTSPLFNVSNGTGTLSLTMTNSPANSNITLTGLTSTGGSILVGSSSETGTYLSTIRVTDQRGSFSELVVTVVVNSPVTLSGSLSITKTYGNSVSSGYSTNGTGTAPFSFSATPICAVVKTVSGSFTYERINGTDSCTWTAPVGVTVIDALLVGAGGGGGGDGGAGGGGGSINTLSSVSLPSNRQVTVQVGAGGAGGIWGGDAGVAGGTTSIASGSTSYTAPGGSAGGGCGSAAALGGSLGTGGSTLVGGNGGFGGTGTGCGGGNGSAGSNGPVSNFTGSNVSYGGGGGGGVYPGVPTIVGLNAGGNGGGGTGAASRDFPSLGLVQYFRAKPANATNGDAFTTGTCADPIVGNINYRTDSYFPCADKNNFQGYATGYFIAPVSGSIKFFLTSDDASKLTININGTNNDLTLTPCCKTVEANWSGFVAGQAYPINVYFTEDGGLAQWILEYEPTGLSRSVIPITQLRSNAEGLAIYFKTTDRVNASSKSTFTTSGPTCMERVGNIAYASKSQFPCPEDLTYMGYATGFFIAPVTGNLTFYISSDDSSYLSINVNGVSNELSRPCCGEASVTWSGFVKGQYYPINVYFTEDGGGASWMLYYEYSGQSKTLVPSSNLRSTASFTAPVQGTNGIGGGGGGGTAGIFKLSGAKGGSGTAILKYLTQSETATQTMITAIVNQETPTGLLTLNVPEFVSVGTYTETIKVQDAANSAPYQAVVTIRINKATPTLALSLPGSVATAKYGNPVTISAVATTPGRVSFVNGSETITTCSSVATTAGLATCSWTPTVVGSTTLRATLTPTDTANYNSSAQVNLPINVAKADTLTVTVASLNRQFTGSAVAVTGAFTTSGLVAIDTLTAISMLYSGTANTGTSRSATTAPTDAGIYTITPNFPANANAYTFGTGSLGTTSSLSNYESVTVVAGTLTINRAPQVMTFAYPNSNTATYSPTGTLTATAITRLDSAVRTYSTSTLTKCTIDSATAVISIVEAGSCQVAMAVAQTFNYLADTATATVTINKASRTFSLTPAVSTLKYSESTTVTATLSGGALDGTISYILGSPAGCTFDPLTRELLAISGTIQCPLRATISEGINYLAETTTAISLTIARANAPVITIDTITALNHTPGVRALVTPNYRVSGLKNLDTADSLTLTYSFVSNPFAPFTYSDTRTPIDAGTYRITPSALTLSVGLMSNYETPTYSSSSVDFIINRINQETVTVVNTNSEVDVPFALYASGGSTIEAFTFNLVSGTACSISGSQLSATAAGTCVVTVTRGGNRNYLPATSASVTVRVRNFVVVVAQAPSNPVTGITIAPSAPPFTKAPDSNACTTGCVPKISSIDVLEGAEGDLVVMTGLSFNGVTKVYFRLDTFSPTDDVEAPNFAVDSDTQISVRVPAGLIAREFYTIRVATPEKSSARFYDIEILP
jgi:hypothetical protein